MGLISGMFMGALFGISIMASWRYMMRRRSRNRAAKAKWLNKQLSKLWPYVAEATSIIIKESVEPILEEYRPSGISALKFSKLSLGNASAFKALRKVK
ncbi:hypothetical protein Ccrd_006809 [Cynara cardunculus var. scolymus]|uniref:SMP-LTD domain-containing protein n=1 Tax=Cynara cardunculus var. scolymus TaxID=59895 RepID=A0A118JU97_CYNCS|nr:hypothetical protein Ccrd_006809 [Cynara cardunculus var. scolymus]